MGAIQQWGEVIARDGTITKLKEQLDKVTRDYIIEDLCTARGAEEQGGRTDSSPDHLGRQRFRA